MEPQIGRGGGMAERRAKLWHLQVLRAVAASLVALDHAITTVLVPLGRLPASTTPAGHMLGVFGVSTFFVISGFIMIRTSTERFGSARAALDFALRRAIRIVPMYWIATLAFIALGARHGLPPLADVTRSLFFIPYAATPVDSMHPLLAQGWTLNYEVFFYALFAVALVFRRTVGVLFIFSALVGVVLAGLLLRDWADPVGSKTAIVFLSRPIILLFAAGIVLGRSTPIQAVPFPLLISVCLYAAIMVGASRLGMGPDAPFPMQAVLWAPGLAAVVLTVFARPKSEGRLDRAGEVLGDSSYCTYLFGSFTLPLLRVATAHAPNNQVAAIFLIVLGGILANIIGYVAHVVLEKPIGRFLAPERFLARRG